ncbi:MAG: cyclopropane-fatty-acyl-phospholipid synthase family protein [Candidatus Thiodiazotropha sp. LLP2]
MSSLQTQSIQRLTSRSDLIDDFLSRLDCLAYGTLEIKINGRQFILNGKDSGGTARIEIVHFSDFVKKLYIKGDIGFAESYMAGDWRSPNLTALLHLLAKNRHRFTRLRRASRVTNMVNRIRHWARRNTRQGSSRNIEAHYDLGNSFYKLWLDSSMTYSCALFNSDQESLKNAQYNKYQRILNLIEPKPGSKLLEIGCGWGGFAVAAAKRQLKVDGITLSPSQLSWANERVKSAGFSREVNLTLTDYRDISGQYDHIVSIEMFEAVGEAYWSEYMEQISTHLKVGGTAALQVITLDETAFKEYRAKPDFIQRYIFPGGMLPPISTLTDIAGEYNLKLVKDDCFGLNYAETLKQWQINFNQAKEKILVQGFDKRFIRMWRYYLSYCEAGFLDGRLDLHQVLLRKIR